MGLIKAAIGAVGGTLADQWKEFFYCEALPKEVLMVKGEKVIGKRSSNKKGNDKGRIGKHNIKQTRYRKK